MNYARERNNVLLQAVYTHMIAFPNAKINIGLNVTRKREDGYHDLETIFYPLLIKDAVEIIEASELKFSSTGILIPGSAGENICVKAYNLLKKDFSIPPVHIHLHKHIPIGAGLGGGSADAAFLIKLLNEKFTLGLSAAEMENYARCIGADCAFFINNKPVYAFEKGDVFENITLNLSEYYKVLVMPPVHVSTQSAYSGIKAKQAEVSLKELINLPIEEWKNQIKNDFEDSVFSKYPLIGDLKKALYDYGAVYASMSGSGASVYGIFKDKVSVAELEEENQVFYNV
ncbi:MAG: ispE [Sphingobacteriales bacterium]|nr:ispE [Sphingobacteriales bacterium]